MSEKKIVITSVDGHEITIAPYQKTGFVIMRSLDESIGIPLWRDDLDALIAALMKTKDYLDGNG